MKILKTILWIIVTLLVIGLITMFALGKKYHFETSMIINAPIEKVYNQASTSQNFNQWNPWFDLDPNMKVEYKGTPGQVGDEYCWEGKDDVGQGCHTITALIPNQKVSTKMLFKKPFESDATSDLTFVSEGNGTKVTWSMDCELEYPMNLMKLMMDKNMKTSYDKGLNKLKTLVETK